MIYLHLLLLLLLVLIFILSFRSANKFSKNIIIKEVDLLSIDKIEYCFFRRIGEIMDCQGFKRIADLFLKNNSGEVYNRILYNASEGIKITASQFVVEYMDTRSSSVLRTRIDEVVQFETIFEDGLKLITTTSMALPVFKHKNCIIYKCFNIAPQQLLARHRQFIRKLTAHTAIVKDEITPNIEDAILKEEEKHINDQIKYGILNLDESGQYYQYTLYGIIRSFFMAIVFPIKKSAWKLIGREEVVICNIGWK
jgi:hypothetical protein